MRAIARAVPPARIRIPWTSDRSDARPQARSVRRRSDRSVGRESASGPNLDWRGGHPRVRWACVMDLQERVGNDRCQSEDQSRRLRAIAGPGVLTGWEQNLTQLSI